MADFFLAEIRVFACNFAPNGWAFCNGQVMSIAQNTALFSLLGTTYGGNGTSTFALPNLQGCVPLHVGGGQGPGRLARVLGETGGAEAVALAQGHLPAHTHAPVMGSAAAGDQNAPAGNLWAAGGAAKGLQMYATAAGTPRTLHPNALAAAGSGTPHNNLPPYLPLNFCIALQGIYPSRS